MPGDRDHIEYWEPLPKPKSQGSSPVGALLASWREVYKEINRLLIDTPTNLVALASMQSVHRSLPAIRDVIAQLDEANAPAMPTASEGRPLT